MKKRLSFVLVCLLLFMCGCSDTAKKNINPQEMLEQYLDNIEKFDIPIREFGEPTNYIDMTEEIVIGILYPETEYEFLNSAIKALSEAVESAIDALVEDRKAKYEPMAKYIKENLYAENVCRKILALRRE